MPEEKDKPAKGKQGGARPNSGPKPKPLDLEEVERMAYFQATDEEIAHRFDLERSTITRRRQSDPEFSEIVERGKAKGRISLRRQQFKLFMEGNATMGVWLGKNVLGQRDHFDGRLTVATLSIADMSDAQLEELVARLDLASSGTAGLLPDRADQTAVIDVDADTRARGQNDHTEQQ